MAYNPLINNLVTVAETAPFIRQAAGLWTDEDRYAFVNFIAANPDAGDVIPATGGLRKIRWSRPGTGKRGGVRIIYFYHDDTMPLYLLNDLYQDTAGKLDLGRETARPGVDRQYQTSLPEALSRDQIC